MPSRSHNGYTYGLYAQCEYLLSHPTIAAYVQCVLFYFPSNTTHGTRVFSVDLCFKVSPEDLMEKFIDTLARLPNLRTLEILSVSHRSPVTTALKHKCAKFPNIREMVVDATYPDFIRTCPNLESLTFRHDFNHRAYMAVGSYCAGLRRIAGVDVDIFQLVRREFMTTSSNMKQSLNGIMSQMW